jgi:hypothetical protein
MTCWKDCYFDNKHAMLSNDQQRIHSFAFTRLEENHQLAEDKVRRLVAYLETVEQDDARSVDQLRASTVYESGSLSRYSSEFHNIRLSQEPTEAKGSF